MLDPVLLEGLFRGAAIGGFATASAALILMPDRTLTRWVGAVFFLCAIGHVVDNYSVLRGTSAHVSVLSWGLSALGPAMFWAFTVRLFTDDERFSWFVLVPGAAALVLSAGTALLPPPAAQASSIAYVGLSAALVAHAFAIIWRGWPGDLVEQRRRLRAPILVAGALYVLVIAAGDLGHVVGLPLQTPALLQALALALLAVAGALTLLRVDEVLLKPAGAKQLLLERHGDQAQPGADPAERLAFDRLNTALNEEELWRRERLTIGVLAAHLSLPEHRLRRLINGRLGYRNFAALINSRRVEAAKIELCDPLLAAKPVSSIAYELGFGSLGPFNRAFKQATGVTPTAWRQGAGTSPNSKNSR